MNKIGDLDQDVSKVYVYVPNSGSGRTYSKEYKAEMNSVQVALTNLTDETNTKQRMV